jgi:hypothetical protein
MWDTAPYLGLTTEESSKQSFGGFFERTSIATDETGGASSYDHHVRLSTNSLGSRSGRFKTAGQPQYWWRPIINTDLTLTITGRNEQSFRLF